MPAAAIACQDPPTYGCDEQPMNAARPSCCFPRDQLCASDTQTVCTSADERQGNRCIKRTLAARACRCLSRDATSKGGASKVSMPGPELALTSVRKPCRKHLSASYRLALCGRPYRRALDHSPFPKHYWLEAVQGSTRQISQQGGAREPQGGSHNATACIAIGGVADPPVRSAGSLAVCCRNTQEAGGRLGRPAGHELKQLRPHERVRHPHGSSFLAPSNRPPGSRR